MDTWAIVFMVLFPSPKFLGLIVLLTCFSLALLVLNHSSLGRKMIDKFPSHEPSRDLAVYSFNVTSSTPSHPSLIRLQSPSSSSCPVNSDNLKLMYLIWIVVKVGSQVTFALVCTSHVNTRNGCNLTVLCLCDTACTGEIMTVCYVDTFTWCVTRKSVFAMRNFTSHVALNCWRSVHLNLPTM